MTLRIEDYALIGDCQTAALVGKDGSVDWLCLPRFDSAACFAALLGDSGNGRWLLAPAGTVRSVRRQYRGQTCVLETEFETATGVVRVIDWMPIRTDEADLCRLVEGVTGNVEMNLELVIRWDYGSTVPWVRQVDDGILAIAGPDALRLHTPVEVHGENFRTVGHFSVSAGQRIPFYLTWHPSHVPSPGAIDVEQSLQRTEEWWRNWCSKCTYKGPWSDAVIRSLITLKALTYAPTGGLVAAPTTSLPEKIGGSRNWDYRYCWLRDATYALYALMVGGYVDEARAWREWLLRAVAGQPAQARIMYGVAGEHRLPELEIPWLEGYMGSKPVRIGNGASEQFQLDVYGEVMDALHYARRSGLSADSNAWEVQRVLLDFLETAWLLPDEGIWEVRSKRQHFTHSKVMAWVAFDRAVKAVERYGLEGPVDKWRSLRSVIHDEICRKGFDPDLNSFTGVYGLKGLDASLLMMPLVGFLPASDPRVKGTVRAIQDQLSVNGFVFRYQSTPDLDGLPLGEGSFLLCTLWLADNLLLQGNYAEAQELFERVLSVRNDVGLLAEEYDPVAGRLLGNFPQALSHVGVINTARNLAEHGGPAEERPVS